MPVDYSKWDNLELSDDSDIEVHPNVDKRSFIRAKQHQIHQERLQRKHDIERLKYERIVNDGLLKRISSLLAALRARASEAAAAARNPAEVAFQAVMESAGRPEDDSPPPRPEGLQGPEGEEENPTYSRMMAALLDQVNKALDEKKPDDRYTAMVDEVQGHEDKVKKLQSGLEKKLAELEAADKKKITSEAYHTGFDSSHVSKSKAEDKGKGKESSSAGPSSTTQVELLNPGAQAGGSAGEADKDKEGGEDEEEFTASPLGKKFAQIKAHDYKASAQFISEHPSILAEREEDGILALGFDAALEGKDDYARQCIHQSVLLKYCRSLGRDGVRLFFQGVTTKGHRAQEMFYKEVQDVYMRIKNRSREIIRERAAAEEGGEGVEQIQLHAMEPGTVINIRIPPAETEDPEEKKAREIYDAFPEEMRKALETESLDEVNKVLGRMKVPEAEDMVAKFGEAGILSLEEQIIDATTEEGKKQLEEMEKSAGQESKHTEDPE